MIGLRLWCVKILNISLTVIAVFTCGARDKTYTLSKRWSITYKKKRCYDFSINCFWKKKNKKKPLVDSEISKGFYSNKKLEQPRPSPHPHPNPDKKWLVPTIYTQNKCDLYIYILIPVSFYLTHSVSDSLIPLGLYINFF